VFAAGVAIGDFLPIPPWAALIALAGGFVAASISVAFGRLTAFTFLAAVFVAGWSRPLETPRAVEFEPADKPCYRVIEGSVASPSIKLENRSSIAVDMENSSMCLDRPKVVNFKPVVGRLYVSVLGKEPVEARQGDRLRLRVKVKPIVPFFNRGLPQPASRNSSYTAAVESRDSIALVGRGTLGPGRLFDPIRRDLALFWQKPLGPKEALLARALTLGESRALGPGQKERFRRTGTAHLLSVSGLHLGLAVLFVFFAIKKALLFFTRLANRIEVGRIAAALSIPWAIAFAFLAGCRTPVVRACVMAVSALAARVMGRRGGTIEAIAVAGVAILTVDPLELLNPGFQLSFAAVIGFVGALKKREPDNESGNGLEKSDNTLFKRVIGRAYGAALNLFRSTLAATAATTPLALFHFGYFSWVSLLCNMIAVPFTGLLILPGLLLVSAAALLAPDLAALAARPLGALLAGLDRALDIVSRTPCTLENTGPLVTSAMMIGSVSVLVLLAGKRTAGFVLLTATAIIGAIGALADPPRFPKAKLTVDFLDVGQGDSTLITFPDGGHWLVDAGGTWTGRFDVGERVVVPALRALGVGSLDKLILTHPDSDHVGGMPAVVDAIGVEEIWENGQGEAEGANDSYRNLLDAARRLGITVLRTPGICGVHCAGQVCVRVIHPCFSTASYDPTMSFNDNSLVLILRYGLVTLALTGDIETEGEKSLVESGAIGHVDVLKLAHHGSGTSSSSAFLAAATPWIAVASLGRFNRHLFPHRNVVGRLKSRNVSLLRTDRLGAVRLVTDGHGISVEGLVRNRGY
jgi:competence protein ComEC